MERFYVEGLDLKIDQTILGPVRWLAPYKSHERGGGKVIFFLLDVYSLLIGTWNTRPRGTQVQGMEAHAAESVAVRGTDQRGGVLHLVSDIVPLSLFLTSFKRICQNATRFSNN